MVETDSIISCECRYCKKNPAVTQIIKGIADAIPFIMARLAGFEPATYRFVAGHSIH